MPFISTPSIVAQPTGVVSANPSIATLISDTESSGQQTTHVTVTSTVVVAPQAVVTPKAAIRIQNVAESFTEALPQTSSVAITHTVTKTPAPDTTGVVYKLYQPDSASAASSDDSNGTKNKVILGAILGPISLVVVILMLIAMWRGRRRTRGKHSKAEEGRGRRREQRSTNDMINEAHRRRRDRNRRRSERDAQPEEITQGGMTDGQVSPLSYNLDRVHLPGDQVYDVSPLSSPTGFGGHGYHR
jgi:hypothetical protein